MNDFITRPGELQPRAPPALHRACCRRDPVAELIPRNGPSSSVLLLALILAVSFLAGRDLHHEASFPTIHIYHVVWCDDDINTPTDADPFPHASTDRVTFAYSFVRTSRRVYTEATGQEYLNLLPCWKCGAIVCASESLASLACKHLIELEERCTLLAASSVHATNRIVYVGLLRTCC